MKRGRERERAEHRVQSTSAAAVFTPAFISIIFTTHTHTTSALVQCLDLSLFVTTLYDQQLRGKDTLRGRAGQTKKDWKSSKPKAIDM